MQPAVSMGMTIGTLSDEAGCNVPTIRYYEEIGLLPPAKRRPSGHRFYAEGDLRRLIFIRRCRDFGFAIEQIQELISLVENESRDCSEALAVTEAHLAAVREKRRELQALEKSLAKFVEGCRGACAGGPTPDCVIFDDLSTPAKSGCCR